VLIRVLSAGICNTDLEIRKGYVPGFDGIPGHEFAGVVEESDDSSLRGARVTAEINAACGTCEYCRKGLGRHCPNRTVLGIINRAGAMAEYVCVPADTVVRVPDSLSDTQAVFIEPLAAACEILVQIAVNPGHEVLVIGDGKLGLLVSFVLQTTGCSLLLRGHHEEKLSIAADHGIATTTDVSYNRRFDIVVEATGNPAAFADALALVKPRGTLVLKSTYASQVTCNLSKAVVDEITIVGSRCGRFSDALALLANHQLPLERLVTASYPLHEAVKAFAHAEKREALKVVLKN
jgi:2-desacetyl-2-hydroxyethyl bacteriochlorophyllide A dehydrogenase